MYSIGALCQEFKLSRSTLLYYDKIGLLTAFKRTGTNYRQYSEADRTRLGQICNLREAGVPLNQIKDILDHAGMDEGHVLEKRLNEINQEIRCLRLKQQMIVEILKRKSLSDTKMPLDRETFISILRSAGLEDEMLKHLHIRFEKDSPDSHQFFLEFLGITDQEIKQIRELSRQPEPK